MPGINVKPYTFKAPLIEGIFSIDIKILGLAKPNMLIWFLLETASESFTSIEGVVSKLSARLQQAAFKSSFELIFKILAELIVETDDVFLLVFIVISSKLLSGNNGKVISQSFGQKDNLNTVLLSIE